MFNRQSACRYGTLLYNTNDIYIGRSLELYGEYSEGEIDLFRQIVRPGDVVVEVGANIGAHTVYFAEAVQPDGFVFALEPVRINFQTLCANLALNSITNVKALNFAVGASNQVISVPYLDPNQPNNFGGITLNGCVKGEATQQVRLDDLGIENCRLLKVDVEGMELAVLKGAPELIDRCRPVLYVENDREENSAALITHIDSLGYDMYWHKPPLFNPNNFKNHPEDVFANILSFNMICIDRKSESTLEGFSKINA